MEIIQDRGPIYNEFVYDSHIHEPWNAFSSLFFFIPVVFWIVFLWGRYKQHRIILLILPLLFLNGLGSTLFHAYRTSNVFLMLDWLPAALMSLSLSVYFWTKITRRWYFGILCVLGFYASAVLVITTLGQGYRVLAPNIGYLFSGSAFLIPIIWSLYRNQWRHARYVLLTLFSSSQHWYLDCWTIRPQILSHSYPKEHTFYGMYSVPSRCSQWGITSTNQDKTPCRKVKRLQRPSNA
ncbi:MAG: hypothetical protein EBQ66_09910 [Flavobacteriia bacterium]|nr:hypothetical protein [Flavobacteriia bacterium]